MQPVLFTVPGLDWEVQAYGFFIGLALILGWVISLQVAKRDGLPAEKLGFVYVVSAVVSLFSARAAWILQHPDAFEGWRSLFILQAGTLAPFAGVVVALVVSGFLVTRRKISVWAWYDALAPAFAVGVVLESFGAFFAGTAFGTYAPDAALTITFPLDSPAYVQHRSGLSNLMNPNAAESLAVHPVQLYAAALGCLGAGLCWWVRPRRMFTGQVFLIFSAYYLVVRSFVEEFFRADAPAPVAGPLNGGQLGALTMVGAIAVVYWSRLRRVRGGDAAVQVPDEPAPDAPSPRANRKKGKKKKGKRKKR